MTHLTPEERMLGRENANRALGVSRRDLLKAAAAAPALGAFYFGYEDMKGKSPVKAAIIGTGDEGCQAMIRSHNRDYLDFIGFCDIRPSQQERAVKEFSNHKDYSAADVKKLKQLRHQGRDVRRPRRRDDRDRAALVAARAGGDRGDERGQARLHREADGATRSPSARRCARSPARQTGCWPSATSGITRSSTTTPTTWSRTTSWATSATSAPSGTATTPSPWSPRTRTATRSTTPRPGWPSIVHDEEGKLVYRDSWKRTYPELDKNIDYKKYGYKSLDELINWRLYNRTGAGLMAELGSHQLDACSIFLGKKHPLAVTGIGGTFFYTDGREVDDHVFTVFEFPGKGEKDRVVVTYSSINTNSFDGYGEHGDGLEGDDDRQPGEGDPAVQGSGQPGRVADDQRDRGDARARSPRWRPARARPARPRRRRWEAWPRPTPRAAIARSSSTSPTASATATQSNYHADKEHQPRCRGEVALADAVIALTSNIAMRQKRRIDFDPRWFDYQSSETPESAPAIAQRT